MWEPFFRCLTWNSIPSVTYLYSAAAAVYHYYFPTATLVRINSHRCSDFLSPPCLVITAVTWHNPSFFMHVTVITEMYSDFVEHDMVKLKLVPLRCFNYGDKQAAQCWTRYNLGAAAFWPLQPANEPWGRPPCEIPHTHTLTLTLILIEELVGLTINEQARCWSMKSQPASLIIAQNPITTTCSDEFSLTDCGSAQCDFSHCKKKKRKGIWLNKLIFSH